MVNGEFPIKIGRSDVQIPNCDPVDARWTQKSKQRRRGSLDAKHPALKERPL